MDELLPPLKVKVNHLTNPSDGFNHKPNMLISPIHILIKPRTQMTHILEDLTYKMEGQPPKKRSVGF